MNVVSAGVAQRWRYMLWPFGERRLARGAKIILTSPSYSRDTASASLVVIEAPSFGPLIVGMDTGSEDADDDPTYAKHGVACDG